MGWAGDVAKAVTVGHRQPISGKEERGDLAVRGLVPLFINGSEHITEGIM